MLEIEIEIEIEIESFYGFESTFKIEVILTKP